MEIIGLIGIVISLVLFMVLVYKGWHSYWTAMICAVIVALTNGVFWNSEGGFFGGLEVFANTFAQGMIDLFATMFWVVILGAILGKLYEDSGMAYSIFKFLNIFVDKAAKVGDKRAIRTAYLWLFIMGGLLTLGGIDPYVALFIMVPICALLCQKLDIPRRLIPGMTCLFTCFIICPGAPSIYNIMGVAGTMTVTGELVAHGNMAGLVTANSGLIAGIIGVLIIGAAAHFYMVSATMKAKANGEHFEWGSMRPVEMNDRPHPHVIVSLLPLIAVFVLYALVGTHISFALAVGIILTIIFGVKFLPTTDRFNVNISLSRDKALLQSLNGGAASGPNALLTVIVPAALAAVITATPAFGMVVGMLSNLHIPPVVLAAVIVMILVAITSSPPAALMIALPMIMGMLMGMTHGTMEGINVGGIMRVAVLAAATFETLPFNGMVILNMDLAHTTHKEAYKPVGMISVVFTLVAAIVGVVLNLIIPGLV